MRGNPTSRTPVLNVLLSAVSLLILVLFLEGAIRVLDLFRPSRIAATHHGESLGDAEATPEPGRAVTGDLIHPLLGWSKRPRRQGAVSWLHQNPVFPNDQPTQWAMDNLHFNVFGYRSYISDYRELGSDDFVVGVFGGSVAAQSAVFSGDALIAGLEQKFPEIEGEIFVLNLGGGGYKQPQQVVTLVEMMMLGVPFDLVINIDGLNEVAFGGVDAHYHKRHPIFPTSSNLRSTLAFSTGQLSPEQIRGTARILSEKENAEGLVRIASSTPVLRRSALFQTIVGGLISKHRAKAVELERLMRSAEEEGDGNGRSLPLAEIPDPCFEQSGSCWDLIADLWQEGSLLMDHIARGSNVEYIHFLQPNQYIEGSKILTAEEKERAFLEKNGIAANARAGYPHLQDRAEVLRDSGVEFHDLTMIFADHPETLYVDTCCHVNLKGYRILVENIVERIHLDPVRRRAREESP